MFDVAATPAAPTNDRVVSESCQPHPSFECLLLRMVRVELYGQGTKDCTVSCFHFLRAIGTFFFSLRFLPVPALSSRTSGSSPLHTVDPKDIFGKFVVCRIRLIEENHEFVLEEIEAEAVVGNGNLCDSTAA